MEFVENRGGLHRQAVFPAGENWKGWEIMGQNVFEFRIVNLSDDMQVIDRTLKTPYDALTPLQMEEYMQIDAQLDYMDRMKRRKNREMRRRENSRGLLHKAACLFGLA
jgi:hypothetical protein